MVMTTQREGWGLTTASSTPGYPGREIYHYFRSERSLCGLRSRQELVYGALHDKPVSKSCLKCRAVLTKEEQNL